MPDTNVRLVHASGDCEIDLGRRELRVLGSAVPVGGRAFEIVEVLARSAGQLVTKDELMDRIWPGAIVTENTLQVHAMAIRKALGPFRTLLKTQSGRGYRLLGDWTVRRLEAAQPPAGLQRMRVDGESPVTNFPATVTRLVGRKAAVARLRDLLSAYRVVTLTGPGGIGKTSLALKAARGIVGEFADGGWLVELASLSDPALVPSTAAHVLGLRLGAGQITAELVARGIGAQKLLLVLDNCEHVIGVAAEFAEILRRVCPNVTILATSRETFRIDGEYVYRVPPLDVPGRERNEPHHILEHSAVELFIARAKALDSDFSPNAADLPTIATICRHLDGIPLAIEFAAARVVTLGIGQVAISLRDRFAALAGGRRTAVPRHRTLRALLDWSYELLSEPERLLFRHLAVFSGGFTLEAAASVMHDTGLGPPAVMDGIADLVIKSLVALDNREATGRWYLLETVRAYALEKLAQHDRIDAIAGRHAAYYRDFSVSVASDFESEVLPNVAACAREIDNVRAALDWSFSTAGDVAVGIALTAAYVRAWLHSVLLVECVERCERALFHLDRQPTANARLQLQLQIGFGLAATRTRRPVDQIRTALASALDIARSLNDVDAEIAAISGLWALHNFSGEPRAAVLFAESLSALGSSVGNPSLVIRADWLIGNTLHHQGDQPRAYAHLERAAERSATSATFRSSFFPEVDQHVSVRALRSRALLLQGHLDQAAEQARICLEDAIATGSGPILCQALRLAVCQVDLMTGNLVAAKRNIATLVDTATVLNGSLWLSSGRCFEGKLLIAQGTFEAGSALLRAELDACERTGWTSWYPEFLGVCAEGLAGLGRFPEALASIDQALAKADKGGERYYAAELLRLRGEVLFQQSPDNAASAQDFFDRAAEMARKQGALFWELRIALSVARLRVTQKQEAEARKILMPVYERFTEGFATTDLQAARAMLDALRGRP